MFCADTLVTSYVTKYHQTLQRFARRVSIYGLFNDMIRHALLPCGFLAIICIIASSTIADADTVRVQYDRDVRPILSDNCFQCHGPDAERREADLRLDVEASAKESVIVPGSPDESELVIRVTSGDPDLRMPPVDSNKQLSAGQIDILRRWIDQGAEWTRHWAFLSAVRPVLPQLEGTSWPRNAIDYFVLKRLQRGGLVPSPEADRRMLIRRLTLDLTGLPPTLGQIDEFVCDHSPDAYERLVNRLLDSYRYGERMAVMWLDLARYGDSSVHNADGHRDMWVWRDRVIEAHNKNVSFEDFSVEQLAGDLLPDASLAQKISAGFNRNNGTTDEGGLIEEECRVGYAVDRVTTTSMVWLGLTMECGQCHDHKYDPISQQEYFQFYAFFNISADKGKQVRDVNSVPIVEIPNTANLKKLPSVLARKSDVEARLNARRTAAMPSFKRWLQALKKRRAVADGTIGPQDAVLHLSFEEWDGQLTPDSARRGRFARVRGKPEWVDGRTFGGLRLAGESFEGETFVDLADAGDFQRDQPFSYGGWVRVDPGASGALLSRMSYEPVYRGYDLFVEPGGRISANLAHDMRDNAIGVTTQRSIEPDTWRHIFVVYDGSSTAAGVWIYVDGDPWETNTKADVLSGSIHTEMSLRIGCRPDRARLMGVVDELRLFDRALPSEEVRALVTSDFVAPILRVSSADWTEEQRDQLREFYLRRVDAEYRALLIEQRQLASEEEQLRKPITTVMVMGDMEEPRATFILNRGAYDSPTDQRVEPGTPSILPPWPVGFPRNRLGLARWLFQPEQPLTARVTVNRYWQMLFGVGLVSTPADFGTQGQIPSHPELLDYLATEFRESGWNVKHLIRQIVTSATYRQSSMASPGHYRRDPQNRLLARGPRFRLPAEFVRDNALAISGLLVDQLGGPAVKPYQPPGLWKEVSLNGTTSFVQDHGEKLYRRSLYTYWKRSVLAPNMRIFDAPTRERCTVHRPRTNTPLQALVTLNDVQFVEAARNFGQRIMVEGGPTPGQRAVMGFRLATARDPTSSELDNVLEVYRQSLETYRSDSEAARRLISVGESPRDESLGHAEHAAWTIVASVLLNLDETLTRE